MLTFDIALSVVHCFKSSQDSFYCYFLPLALVILRDVEPSKSMWKIVFAFPVIFLVRHWRLVVNVIRTFPRDITGISRFITSSRELTKYQKCGESLVDEFNRTVKKYPSKVCFVFENKEWTFQEVWELSNQFGNYFLSQGYKKGDVVALFMENCPQYICIWMGMSKIGVVTCLLNSNLRLKPLTHSLNASNCRAIIYDEVLSQAISEVVENETMMLFSFDTECSDNEESLISKPRPRLSSQSESLKLLEERSTNLSELLKGTAVPKTEPGVQAVNRQTFTDTLFCVYTSGTTGLPKAAIIRHSRFLGATILCHRLNAIRPSDVVYTALPLFHTSAEFLGVGHALMFGNTVIIRKKFSATAFWKDCIDHKVTVALHIGEICRYLLNQPVTPDETQHQVRLMFGNGLRPEIWREFVSRFRIPHISEFYASTEGNCNMLNFDNRVGAVGFVPILLYKLYPVGLFKIVEETGEIIRNPKNGLAIQCGPNEPGELMGKIVKGSPIREFNGYAMDLKQTEKKIASGIFSKGDSAFRTGDYLVMDDLGYFYFKDRTGDTFRWKGENVSTTEVESVISGICGLKDGGVCVFGVGIPGTDGKCGMAAIADPNNTLDFSKLADEIRVALPSYARPLFLRILKKLETTGTHKIKKFDLQKEGFDVTKITNPIYFYTNGSYVRLDEDLFLKIVENKIRL